VTVTAQTSDRNSASLLSRYYEVHPTYRLIVRWALIALLTAVAFWRSFFSIGVTAHEDGLGGYVWTVPTAAILVAVGLARRHRTELPIHDRQTDIIVGTMGLPPLRDGAPATSGSVGRIAASAMGQRGEILFAEEGSLRVWSVDAATGIAKVIAGRGFAAPEGEPDQARAVAFGAIHALASDAA